MEFIPLTYAFSVVVELTGPVMHHMLLLAFTIVKMLLPLRIVLMVVKKPIDIKYTKPY
uniref:Uncharacterized protein n=1 Tax=Papilio xuthus TaxID=66420 RepID=I4DLM5_PAPXU|nr:unknown unsecreted protein [Papilio xuthus]